MKYVLISLSLFYLSYAQKLNSFGIKLGPNFVEQTWTYKNDLKDFTLNEQKIISPLFIFFTGYEFKDIGILYAEFGYGQKGFILEFTDNNGKANSETYLQSYIFLNLNKRLKLIEAVNYNLFFGFGAGFSYLIKYDEEFYPDNFKKNIYSLNFTFGFEYNNLLIETVFKVPLTHELNSRNIEVKTRQIQILLGYNF